MWKSGGQAPQKARGHGLGHGLVKISSHYLCVQNQWDKLTYPRLHGLRTGGWRIPATGFAAVHNDWRHASARRVFAGCVHARTHPLVRLIRAAKAKPNPAKMV